MDFFTVLPMIKNSTRSIDIMDKDNNRIGYIRRETKSTLERIKNCLSFLETRNLVGESNGVYLEIKELPFKSNLIKLKWNVHLWDENNVNKKEGFLLEDKTKISTNPQFQFTKDNKTYI